MCRAAARDGIFERPSSVEVILGDFVERLQAALGKGYVIRNELSGGGMSRVFVADEVALDRPVVVKLLHPELAAGVNVERFKREVQLLARLQHPHIVPVLSAGEVDGLPYYVMPFVRGESLRARIARGPIPPHEVAGLLGDVAKALAAAHAEGVVHRDIKPDNILVSGGAAVVADFGIAKALSSARVDTNEALTSLGTSLGTPAYMAPEQVAGDPNVDHRADLYSLGCVAYEALTGQMPFAGKSPQQMLAAHVVETPVPVSERKPDLPAPLAAAVMLCLEKEPAKRPQTAAELAALLDTSVTTNPTLVSVPAPRRRRLPMMATAAAAVVLLSAAVFAYRSRANAVPADEGLAVAVAPFDVLDPQLTLWKEGMVDVLSRNVDGAGSIRAISPAVAIKKWSGRADRGSAIEFGKRVGAALVLYGQVQSAGRELVDTKVWIADVVRGASPLEIQVRDSSSRMDRVTDSLSVKVLAAIGRDHAVGSARLASLGSGSLPAIKAFLQGSQYFRRTQWDSAVASFQEAVALDSTFAIAYGMLGQSLGWTEGSGGSGTNAAYIRGGDLIRPGLSPRDSLLLTAMKHWAKVRPGPDRANELRQALAASGAAAARYPSDAYVLYVDADMRYHGDVTMGESEAVKRFDRAVAADSDFAPAWVHATELSYRRGADVGRHYSREYLARNPRDVEADGLRLAASLSDPGLGAKARAAILDTVPLEVIRRAFPALLHLADSAETSIAAARAAWKRAPAERRQLWSINLSMAISTRGHVSEAWDFALGGNPYLAGQLAGLGLVPTDSALKVLRPWLDRRDDGSFAAVTAMAIARDTASLLKTIARMDSAMSKATVPFQRAMISYFGASVRAYLALARGDTATATRLFDTLPDSIVAPPFDQFMRARLVARQDPRRALKLLDTRGGVDILLPVRELERARIAERLGERQLAVESYGLVADLWQNTDSPQLRNARDEARAALTRLDSDGRLRAELARR